MKVYEENYEGSKDTCTVYRFDAEDSEYCKSCANQGCSVCNTSCFIILSNKKECLPPSLYVNKGDLDMINENKPVHDNVEHPAHYEREGAIECIDEMLMVFGITAVMNFCKCNAWKYRYRAADKNGAEDIAKSDWYMRKYKELWEKDNF